MIPVRIRFTEIAPAFAKRFKRSAGRTLLQAPLIDQPLELRDKAMLECCMLPDCVSLNWSG